MEKTAAAAAARISLLLARMNKLMWLLHNAVAEAALLQYGCELPLLELNKTGGELSSLFLLQPRVRSLTKSIAVLCMSA